MSQWREDYSGVKSLTLVLLTVVLDKKVLGLHLWQECASQKTEKKHNGTYVHNTKCHEKKRAWKLLEGKRSNHLMGLSESFFFPTKRFGCRLLEYVNFNCGFITGPTSYRSVFLFFRSTSLSDYIHFWFNCCAYFGCFSRIGSYAAATFEAASGFALLLLSGWISLLAILRSSSTLQSATKLRKGTFYVREKKNFAGGCLGWSRAERPSVSWTKVSKTLWSNPPVWLYVNLWQKHARRPSIQTTTIYTRWQSVERNHPRIR